MKYLAIDVLYDDANNQGRVAGVVFDSLGADKPVEEHVFDKHDIAPYEPGAFYKRELPCILEMLGRLETLPEVIFVDGYVDLGVDHPGLGRHLFDALDGKIKVIGVAKTPFWNAPHLAVNRASSTRPLWVTAAGMAVEEARDILVALHGPYRVPTMLKAVDSLSRGA